MSYHPLTNETGGSADDRRNEADRILNMLSGHVAPEEMKDNEAKFVGEMLAASSDHSSWHVSPKQLFWLRDIKEKYL